MIPYLGSFLTNHERRQDDHVVGPLRRLAKCGIMKMISEGLCFIGIQLTKGEPQRGIEDSNFTGDFLRRGSALPGGYQRLRHNLNATATHHRVVALLLACNSNTSAKLQESCNGQSTPSFASLCLFPRLSLPFKGNRSSWLNEYLMAGRSLVPAPYLTRFWCPKVPACPMPARPTRRRLL